MLVGQAGGAFRDVGKRGSAGPTTDRGDHHGPAHRTDLEEQLLDHPGFGLRRADRNRYRYKLIFPIRRLHLIVPNDPGCAATIVTMQQAH